MSILNAAITPTRALIAVDTDARAATGERTSASKLFYLPGSHVVVGFRGDLDFLQMLVAHVFAPIGDGLDAVARVMPDLARQSGIARREMLKKARETYPNLPDVAIGKQEILLVGWSAQRAGIFGHAINFESGGVQRQDCPTGLASPADAEFVDAIGGVGRIDDASGMERLARAGPVDS